MLTLTERLPADPLAAVSLTIALTAFERTRSRHRLEATAARPALYIHLPRGTVLYDGDLLRDRADNSLVRVVAKAEPVLTVTAKTPRELLGAAYHLGNRHVALEIAPTYLRLASDSVLKAMLEQLPLEVKEEIAPFQPEMGAYKHSHAP
jgi:urease accessory protein